MNVKNMERLAQRKSEEEEEENGRLTSCLSELFIVTKKGNYSPALHRAVSRYPHCGKGGSRAFIDKSRRRPTQSPLDHKIQNGESSSTTYLLKDHPVLLLCRKTASLYCPLRRMCFSIRG
jgi:hypothetical protein